MNQKLIEEAVKELLAEFSTGETVLDDNEDVYIKGTAKDFANALEHRLTQTLTKHEDAVLERVREMVGVVDTEFLALPDAEDYPAEWAVNKDRERILEALSTTDHHTSNKSDV